MIFYTSKLSTKTDKSLVITFHQPVPTPEGRMQPESFESLISPPWPAIQPESNIYKPPHLQRQPADLAIFERNDDTENNLDHIAVLGYD